MFRKGIPGSTCHTFISRHTTLVPGDKRHGEIWCCQALHGLCPVKRTRWPQQRIQKRQRNDQFRKERVIEGGSGERKEGKLAEEVTDIGQCSKVHGVVTHSHRVFWLERDPHASSSPAKTNGLCRDWSHNFDIISKWRFSLRYRAWGRYKNSPSAPLHRQLYIDTIVSAVYWFNCFWKYFPGLSLQLMVS